MIDLPQVELWILPQRPAIIRASDIRRTALDELFDAALFLPGLFRAHPVPFLSNATGVQSGAAGAGTADLSVTTDTANGIQYWVITTTSTPPTTTQIKAGQKNNGTSAGTGRFGSNAISAVGVKNFSTTGLTFPLTYFMHTMQENFALQQSNIASSPSWNQT